MNKITKKITLWFLIVAMALSCTSVFAAETAEEAKSEERVAGYSDYIKNIAKNIALFGRYESLIENDLYLTAIEALIDEDPELYEKAIRAMLESVDENSAYFTAEEAQAYITDMSDEIEGIGVNVILSGGNIIVSQPIPGSPAEKAGIKAGDIIIAADGINLQGMDMDTALGHIRGPKGTSVKVTVLRSGMDAPMTFSIVREKVVSSSVDVEILEEDGKRIAKINVYYFSNNVAKQFEDALSQVEAENIDNIIIDLRGNGGGYFDQAIQMANMFLPKDAVITTEDHKVDLLDKTYKATGSVHDFNIVILIDEISASSSEVFTAALMENNVATVIGQKSFGKGTVQALYDVPPDGLMKFTIAYYLTPEGNNIHGIGITPHAVVENSAIPMDMSEYEYFDIVRKYQVGDRGEEVENAKKMLSTLGLFVGEINDIYDENLKIAVTMFQEATELYPYGVLDFTTQVKLYDVLKEVKVEVDDQLEAAIDAF